MKEFEENKIIILIYIFYLQYIVEYDNILKVATRQKKMCDFEKVILKAIEKAGLTQVELAAQSGVSQGLLSLFLETDPSKRRTITLPVANRICKALGLRLVQTRKMRRRKMKSARKFYFQEGCDKECVRSYCEEIIQIGRGKMVCEQILSELESGCLTEKTKNWLSKWVNPARREPKVESIFNAMSKELFGYRIGRSDREK